jgi:putative ABC transport system permease protein
VIRDGWDSGLDRLGQDLRFGLRLLARRPGPTLLAVFTLALGIGATTAIFSLVNAVLVRPLPYPESERLVLIFEDGSHIGVPRNDVAPANYVDWKAQSRAFTDVAAVTDRGFVLTGDAEPEQIQAQSVTGAFFSVLGVSPALGRAIDEEDDRPGASAVVVLSDRLWRRRFGADPAIVGQQVLLSGEKHTVIGVMPRGFVFRQGYVGLWVPAALSPEDLAARKAHYLTVVARTRPGVGLAEAEAEVATIATRIARDHPSDASRLRAIVRPLREDLTGATRRPLLVLSLSVTFVLLIACANLASLQLARAAARGREIAVRGALGASRGRIARQMLTESVVVSALALAPALLFATWSFDLLQHLVPVGIAVSSPLALDREVVAGAVGITLFTGILFGLAPALHSARADFTAALKQGGRGVLGSRKRGLRGALVVAEVAATFVLLVGAGLLVQTLYRLRYTDLGLRPDHVLTLRTRLPLEKYDTLEKRAAFYDEVLSRLGQLPGVVAAGYTTSLPLEWKGGANNFVIEGRAAEPEITYNANHRQVSTGYLQAMGIPLRRGRYLDATDRSPSMPVALVNETMAHQYWPHEEVLGRRFRVGASLTWRTVVGVVGDVRQMGLDAPVKAEMYLPHEQVAEQPWFAPRDLIVRTSADPMPLAPAIKREIRAVDPAQPVALVRTLGEVLDEDVAERRLGTSLLLAFAAAALILASGGIYGVLASLVTEATSEIGVRVAVGATRRQVVGLIVGQGMRLTLAGIALGALGALALSRVLASQLYGVQAADPATFAIAASVVGTVALLACALPARQAARVDPLIALRSE